MKTRFLIKRSLFVLVSAFAILATVYWLRGNEISASLLEAARWSIIATCVFVVSAIVRLRNPAARDCALCNADEVRPPHRDPGT